MPGWQPPDAPEPQLVTIVVIHSSHRRLGMNEEVQRLNEDESRKKIGNGGDRIYPNANGQPCVKTIPHKGTLGAIFRMIMREAGPIAGAKMDCLASRNRKVFQINNHGSRYGGGYV